MKKKLNRWHTTEFKYDKKFPVGRGGEQAGGGQRMSIWPESDETIPGNGDGRRRKSGGKFGWQRRFKRVTAVNWSTTMVSMREP
jgi:hypothetical protein